MITNEGSDIFQYAQDPPPQTPEHRPTEHRPTERRPTENRPPQGRPEEFGRRRREFDRRREFERRRRYYEPYYPPYYEQPPVCPYGATPYIVQPGDSLYSIAYRFGISIDAIVSINPYIDFNALQIGQNICIPV